MSRRPIGTRLHGILDYVTGATLLVVPGLLGLGGTTAGRVLRAAGAGHASYSLLTDYELGVRRLIPMPVHLGLDAAGALGLVAAPWVFGTARKGRRHWLPHVAFGLYELGAVALSDPTPSAAPASA